MRKTILAIDDDRDMLAFYQAMLAGVAEVKTALDLREARAQLAGVDLILLDFNLEHDRETIQETMAEFKPVAPVLLCTGVQNLEVGAVAATLGIAGYWNKGADHQKLMSMVKSLLSRQAAPGT